MPTAPPYACPCGGTRQAGQPCIRCGKGGKREARRAHDRQRGTAAQRGYDYRWQQFRRVYLARYPLCKDCEDQGLVTAATDIHHEKKLSERPDLKYEETNLMALCSKHHDQRTARGE